MFPSNGYLMVKQKRIYLFLIQCHIWSPCSLILELYESTTVALGCSLLGRAWPRSLLVLAMLQCILVYFPYKMQSNLLFYIPGNESNLQLDCCIFQPMIEIIDIETWVYITRWKRMSETIKSPKLLILPVYRSILLRSRNWLA